MAGFFFLNLIGIVLFFFFDFASTAQIDVAKPGNTIILRNARVEMFNGFMRLSVDRWGTVKLAPEPARFEVNTANDLSATEYELVAVPDED